MDYKKKILQEMGIEVWKQKTQEGEIVVSTSSIWEKLERTAQHCKLCDLHKTRTLVVMGDGNKKAEILFIGEAPGEKEDLQGKPFVGRAGLLLNEMLRSIGLKREDVYIANVVKCRPPGNRNPLPIEVQNCSPYLKQQITLIQPRFIVAVGRVAAQCLLNTVESMSKLRGKWFKYGSKNIPLIVTYHPAYLLRSPKEKSKAYVDFLAIKKASENK